MSSKEELIDYPTLLNFNCKFIFRLINLIFNGLIVRNVDLRLIGIGNIHLELIYSTILFLSRESLRRNIPKSRNISSISHYINLIWLILPFGFVFLIISFFFILFLPRNDHEKLFCDYNQGCFMYGLAAFIELLSEPLYLLATITRNDRINIFIQLIASIIGFGLQTILIIKNPDSVLFYYGFGCIIYSTLITLFSYFYFLIQSKEDRVRLFLIRSFNDLLVKPTSPFVDDRLLHETFQSFKKILSIRILTEGEKYLLTMFSLISYEEQGIYHLISLLGSIFPQIIFPTIDQISSNYFHRTFFIRKVNPEGDQPPATSTGKEIFISEERTMKLNALTLLNKLTRLLMLISLLLIVFVLPHSSIIIKLYLGRRFSSVFYLRLYLIIIFLNSIKILNESFVQLIMSKKQLNEYENWILFYSFIYLIISLICVKCFGLIGIFIGNSLNILGRILIDQRYFIRIEWFKSCLFSSHYLVFLFLSLLIFYFNQILIENSFGEFLFAVGWILMIICLTLIEEKEMIHYLSCIYKLNSQKSLDHRRHF